MNLGLPEYHCGCCGSLFWSKEHMQKSQNTLRQIFSLCCHEERVDLPLFKETSAFYILCYQVEEEELALKFQKNIRVYNSIFAFY